MIVSLVQQATSKGRTANLIEPKCSEQPVKHAVVYRTVAQGALDTRR